MAGRALLLLRRRGQPSGRLEDAWERRGWSAVLVVGLLAFLASAVGSHQLLAAAGTPVGALDAAYLGITSFVLGAPLEPGIETPMLLQIGRFLAPLTLATATMRALSQRLRTTWDAGRARAAEAHTVIVGLSRAGARLAVELASTGRKVVVVETDRTHARSTEVRRAGVAIVWGDGSVGGVLERAGIRRAARLVSLTGTETSNAAVATALNAIVADARGTRPGFRSYVQMEDPWALADVQRAQSPAVRLHQDVFSLTQRAAQLVASRLTPSTEGYLRRRVVLTGAGPVALHLITRLAQEHLVAMHELDPVETTPLELTVVVASDDDGAAVGGLLREGGYRDTVTLAVCTVPDAQLPYGLAPALGGAVPTHVVVADADAVRRLRVSVAVGAVPELARATVTVVVDREHALESMADDGSGRSAVVVLPDDVCSERSITSGWAESIAMSIHERYRRTLHSRASQGQRRLRAADEPWEALMPGQVERNMAAATGLVQMLADAGLRLVPLRDAGAAREPLPEDLVHRLAALEHERWRRRKFGPTGGQPWERVSELDRALTLEQLRATPAILAFVGYQLEPAERRPAAASDATV